ncbi:MAG: S41 family peptidase [Muribaculaceae bacterium]
MKTSKNLMLLMPIAIAISVVLGILIGNRFSNQRYISDSDRKLNTILNLISEDYVDTVDVNNLVEMSIPKILSNLDPHSSYIPAKDLRNVTDELEGSFCGIGISFVLMNDSIKVVEVISGGPSEKVGLNAGDRIVTVNDTSMIGITSDKVMSLLRGAKGSKVKLGIKRSNSRKLLKFTITRDDIPVTSIDASYMADKKTGYVKVNKFGKNTYDEFLNNLVDLKKDGAKRYIIDLRGNGGGFMESAILMVNEFLPENQLIVFTKGREKKNDSQVWSDGNGSFKDVELIVLIDEYSASASEIFAGAIQDNDRGLVIGRRSFGKGLVQRQISLPDSSAIRLTVARYYTPSGRCIQKDFKPGEDSAYGQELINRYSHGELYSRDSIKIDQSKIFETSTGRIVYGGGGIIPDIFVPSDTTGITSYYVNIVNAGLLQKFAFQYTDINREAFKKMKDYKQFLRVLPSDEALLGDFAIYASQNGVPARWYYINLSRNLLVTQLKALIARDVFGNEAFYPIFNKHDRNIEMAIKAFNKHKATFPILKAEDK